MGFGPLEGRCRSAAAFPEGRGRAYWCPACESARTEHISAQLQSMIDTLQRREQNGTQ